MANKLKKRSGQPGIREFLSFSDSELPSRYNKKKRTLPSVERIIPKRLNFESKHRKNTMGDNKDSNEDIMMNNNDNESVMDTDKDSDSDSDGDELGSCSADQLAFERRLMKSMSRIMKKELRSVKSDLKKLNTIQKKQEKHIEEIEIIKQENKVLKTTCTKVLQENKNLKERINKIENTLLDNNVILHGLREDPWELESNRMETVIRVISRTIDEPTEEEQLEMARKIRIKSTRRLGHYSTKKNRPISVCFERFCDADYVLGNKRFLPKGVFADKEYSEETENNRRILRPIYRAARNSETYAGKCKMEGDTLVIRGLSYTVKDINKLPDDLKSFDVTSKCDPDKICFFGELNPLSNFHPCVFHVEGIEYHSAEQYIAYQKALHFKDTSTAEKILSTSTALGCKQAARSVSNFDSRSWTSNAKEICKPGIEAKFKQNTALMNLLINTGTKTLAEASYDNVFGTGVPLHSDNCLKENKWEGVGILGEILMDIRSSTPIIIGGNTQPSENPNTNGSNTSANG